MTNSEYKLTYYNLRGLGEHIRFLFAYKGISYEDKRIHVEGNYPRLSKSIKDELPYGKVPILEVDGKTISQTRVIGRFLAKRFNLYGADEFEAAKIDEIIDAAMDFQNERRTFYNESDPVKKEAKQKELLEYILPKYMGQFNKIVKENGGKYYVGSGPSIADFYMAHFVNMMQERFPDILKDYPDLTKAGEGILELPQIKDWISKRPKDDEIPQ